MHLNVKKWVGNFLIVASILGLTFIYYPYIKELLLPPTITPAQRVQTGFSIEIPTLKVFSKVIENVDPYNEPVYLEKLKYGVAHAKGTDLPGQGGTVFFFAHSSDVPWRITRYNTAFFKLEFIKNGDIVNVRYEGKEYRYLIYDKKTVWPSEVGYLKEDQGDILILQTCTPVGTDLQRLLVFARPI